MKDRSDVLSSIRTLFYRALTLGAKRRFDLVQIIAYPQLCSHCTEVLVLYGYRTSYES